MVTYDDEPQSVTLSSHDALAEESRQAALRQAYDQRQAALAEQTARIKEHYGVYLDKQVSVAGIEDDEIKALAVDHMARSMAERGVELPQMSGEDRRRLADQSIEQAYKLHEAQQREQVSTPAVDDQQQRDPMQGVRPHDLKRDYSELQETHAQVAKQIAAGGIEQTSSAPAQDEQATVELKQEATTQQQAAPDPSKPVEIQDHSPAETHHGKVDRVAEFLKIDRADRDARKAALQELGKAHGKELTEHEGKDITRDLGGGISI